MLNFPAEIEALFCIEQVDHFNHFHFTCILRLIRFECSFTSLFVSLKESFSSSKHEYLAYFRSDFCSIVSVNVQPEVFSFR